MPSTVDHAGCRQVLTLQRQKAVSLLECCASIVCQFVLPVHPVLWKHRKKSLPQPFTAWGYSRTAGERG